jgi:ABC-2 type transport system permease protein
VELPMMEAPESGPIPAGWRVIGAREAADYLLSVRFLILFALIGIIGVGWIFFLSSTIKDAVGAIASQPTFNGETYPVFLFLFSVSPAASNAALQAVPPFSLIVGVFLAPLMGLLFGFDAVSNERAEGTLPRLVSQPIHRDDVINGKFVASIAIVALIVGAGMLLLAGFGMYQLGVIPSLDVTLRLIAWFVVIVLYAGFWLSFAVLASVVFRRAATAALTVLAVWLVLTFFGVQIATIIAGYIAPYGDNGTAAQQVANSNLGNTLVGLLPNGMFGQITQVLLDPSKNTFNLIAPDPTGRAVAALLPVQQSLLVVWPQIVLLVGLMVACFAGAYVAFMRQEVRA